MGYQVRWVHPSDPSASGQGWRDIPSRGGLTIGREEGVDVLLKDASVSRMHAEIYQVGDGIFVRDCKSANGVKLNGAKVSDTPWRPGQTIEIGRFRFEMRASAAAAAPVAASEVILPGNARDLSRIEPVNRGRIQLGQVFERAKSDDREAVHELMRGFLGRTEQVIDCGYLGAIGLIFPMHSFWAVTNSRVCGLQVNRLGWVQFQFGFLQSLNRATFNQPSMLLLWIIIIAWVLWCLSGIFGAFHFLYTYGSFSGFAITLLISLGMLALTPLIVWLYHRFEKAGCVFWTRELVPIWIPSDRHRVHTAQRFVSLFTDQKRMAERA